MKVSELIEALQQEQQDAEVHFSYDYSDYYRRCVFAPLIDIVDTVFVKQDEEVDGDVVCDVPDEDTRFVVVLSSNRQPLVDLD